MKHDGKHYLKTIEETPASLAKSQFDRSVREKQTFLQNRPQPTFSHRLWARPPLHQRLLHEVAQGMP